VVPLFLAHPVYRPYNIGRGHQSVPADDYHHAMSRCYERQCRCQSKFFNVVRISGGDPGGQRTPTFLSGGGVTYKAVTPQFCRHVDVTFSALYTGYGRRRLSLTPPWWLVATNFNSWPTFSPYLYNRVWSELTCSNPLSHSRLACSRLSAHIQPSLNNPDTNGAANSVVVSIYNGHELS